MGFQRRVHLAMAANWGKRIVKATQRKWEGGMSHKLNMRSSHVSVPKRTPNRHSKTVARKYQRHERNHSGSRCCKGKKECTVPC